VCSNLAAGSTMLFTDQSRTSCCSGVQQCLISARLVAQQHHPSLLTSSRVLRIVLQQPQALAASSSATTAAPVHVQCIYLQCFWQQGRLLVQTA
jgi:hypothetical protein